MEPRTKAILRFLLGVTILAAGGVAVYSFRNTPESRLQEVRSDAAQLLDGQPEQRAALANRCANQASSLLDYPDGIGTTAMLYYIGMLRLSNADPSVAKIPPLEDVKQVETRDLVQVARLLFHTDRLGPADQMITLALNRDDMRAESLRAATLIRYELGRDAEVMQHTEELVKLDPSDPRPYRVQMMVHRNHGRWDHLVEAAEKAVKLTSPIDWVLQIELIDGYTHLGRTEDARREFDRVQKEHPELIERAPVMHARLLLQEGKTAQARNVIDHFLSQSPDDTEALLLLGKLQAAQSEYEDAIKTFQHAIKLDPAAEQAYYQLGQVYARTGDTELGREYLNKHRELLDAKIRLFGLEQQAAREPFNADVRQELADSYSEIGLDELAEFWSRAARTAREEP